MKAVYRLRDYGSSEIHEQLGVGEEVGVHDEEGVDSGEVFERGISKDGCDWMRACINDARDSDRKPGVDVLTNFEVENPC